MEDDETRRKLIEEVLQASKLPSRTRDTDIKPTIRKLAGLAYEHGLPDTEIGSLTDLLTQPSHLDQASQNLIIANLYPAGKVAGDVVLKIVGCLGFGNKPPLTIQCRLLEWLILVHHVIENTNVLSRSYAVLFNLIGMDTIRPQLYHLLALSTQRKHVTRSRIQQLLTLASQKAGDVFLQGLLRIYKNYYPEIPASFLKRSPFKIPDPEWRARLEIIQSNHRALQATNANGQRNGFKSEHASTTNGYTSLIPAVQTSNAHEKSITLEEIDSAERLVQNLDKIQLPDHAVAVISDPLFQKFMALQPDLDLARATSWMQSQAEDIKRGELSADDMLQLLTIAKSYARSSKTMLAFVPQLIEAYERTQHPPPSPGDDLRMDLLTYHPLVEWPVFFNSTARICLENKLDGTIMSQLALLATYQRLLHRWTIAMLITSTPSASDQAIAGLVEHVASLCITIIQSPKNSEKAQHHILDFYEQVASTSAHETLSARIPFMIPPAIVVYTLCLSSSPAIVSRLCGLLATLKQIFAKRMSQKDGRAGPLYDRARVDEFNSFLMDTCNCLWRNKAFTKVDKLSKGFLVPESVKEALATYLGGLGGDLGLASVCSLTYAPALCRLSAMYMQQLEDAETQEADLDARHAGPVTVKSLKLLAQQGGLQVGWQEYRAGLLRRMEEEGLVGVPALLYNTMKGLNDAVARASSV